MAQITVVYNDFEEMKEAARIILGLDPEGKKVYEAPMVQMPPQNVIPQQTAPASAQVQAAPVQQTNSAPQTAVPTATTEYTLDDLARAGMTLMDSNRQADLQQLLAQFGVAALPALPKEQYGAFATALREKGAQI